MIESFSDLTQRQDVAVARNRSEAPQHFELTEQILVLAFRATLAINDPECIELHRAMPAAEEQPQAIIANLLHSSAATLVSAVRLALYGAHVDALALTRTAFEAAYHAEYFRYHPSDALEWDKAGQIADLEERRQFVDQFTRKKQIRKTLDERGPPGRGEFYRELSSFGPHVNPATVVLKLSIPGPGKANLGFMSVGKSEATRLCASHILHVAAYTLSEMEENFAVCIHQDPDLTSDIRKAIAEFRGMFHDTLGLSLLR